MIRLLSGAVLVVVMACGAPTRSPDAGSSTTGGGTSSTGGSGATGGGSISIGGGTASTGGGASSAGGTASTGGGTSSAGGGSSGTGGGLPAATPNTDCDGTPLLQRNADLSAKGPWAVGARRTTINGMLTEIWYPAAVGSEAGKTKLSYDIREDLPPNDATKITDAENPFQPCDCYRDLPIDTAHGKFPLVVFIHGTAGFKTQNLDNAVHWASRGFIVMAANHPGLSIASLLMNPLNMSRNLKGDVQKEIAAVENPTGDLASFAGRVDVNRIALAGHSAGGAIATMGDLPGVRVLMPISSGTVASGPNFQSTLYITGMADQVITFNAVSMGYDRTMARMHKRLVGVAGAAHTGVTSLCGIKNGQGETIFEVASRTGVLNPLFAMFAGNLFDCARNTTTQAEAIPVVNAATAGVLEETLRCQPPATAELSNLKTKFMKVDTYKQEP